MNDTLTVVIGLLAALVLGLAFGLSVSDKAWQKDCDIVGKHRSDDKVYFCFPEGGK
jgi:hypothetical protein